MKNLTLLLSILMTTLVLTACGGGESSTSVTSNPNTPVVNPILSENLGELIVDNGRGTTNNQETERPK